MLGHFPIVRTDWLDQPVHKQCVSVAAELRAVGHKHVSQFGRLPHIPLLLQTGLFTWPVLTKLMESVTRK